MRRRKQKIKQYEVEIVKSSNHGDGIGYVDDKIVFVAGAMVGETVIAQRKENRAKFEKAYVVEVLTKSSKRIEPKCAAFDRCGGCALQHMSVNDQLTIKQNWLGEALLQSADVKPKNWLKPLTDEAWGYRRKARLGMRFVAKKDKVLVGFRERGGQFITDMDYCEVLHPAVGAKLLVLQDCIGKLSIKSSLPQIEVIVSDEVTVLVLRHLEPLSKDDLSLLKTVGREHDFCWYLQSGSLDTITPLESGADLYYNHPEHSVRMWFLPHHFTQVNFAINEKMVTLAIKLLALNSDDFVLDLFCGLGNFTLPIARYAKKVVGVEGDKSLVEFAKTNADKNALTNVEFYQADLFQPVADFAWCRNQTYNKALIDPARSGALEVIEHLPKLGVERLVYVSCNPDTLARDTKRLLELGYTLETAGIMDMFPHTKHIESIALYHF